MVKVDGDPIRHNIFLSIFAAAKENAITKTNQVMNWAEEGIAKMKIDDIYLYRMTHIENIPHILQYGIVHNSSPNRNPDFVSIGDKSLIDFRSTKSVNACGKNIVLGDFIPFYFGVRMPMLLVIQTGWNFVEKARKAEEIDARMVLHLLSTQDYDDSKSVFYFSSWDRTIKELRDEMHKEFPNTFKFFSVYDPGTLMRILSMEKIHVNDKWMNEVTFTYADRADNINQRMRNLVDHVLLPLFNTEPESIQFFNRLYAVQRDTFGDGIMEDDSSKGKDTKVPIEQILDDMRKSVQLVSSERANFGEYLNDPTNHDYVYGLFKDCSEALKNRKYSVNMVEPLKEHYQQYWINRNKEYREQMVIN